MKSKSFKTNVTNSSYLFDNLSDEWWNYNGYFKALHSFNLVRVDYIKRKTFNNSLNGLSVLDIGCGGGILCEPLSRLGALVTGIDSSERAIKVAKDMGIKVIGITGKEPGKMDGECDVLVNVPSDKTNKIQEMHIIVGHFICGKVETKLFP